MGSLGLNVCTKVILLPGFVSLWVFFSSSLLGGLTIYADDVTLYVSNSNIIEAQRYLQFDIYSVVQWFSQNKLLVNPNKSSCMVIRGRQKVNEVLTIKIYDTDLEQVNVFKLLGVYIDNNLSFKDHCDHIVKTLSPKVRLLSRLSHIFPATMIMHYLYGVDVQAHIFNSPHPEIAEQSSSHNHS